MSVLFIAKYIFYSWVNGGRMAGSLSIRTRAHSCHCKGLFGFTAIIINGNSVALFVRSHVITPGVTMFVAVRWELTTHPVVGATIRGKVRSNIKRTLAGTLQPHEISKLSSFSEPAEGGWDA
jgi:hypothetical protein